MERVQYKYKFLLLKLLNYILFISKSTKNLDGQATIIPKNNMYPQYALTPAYQKTALSNIDVEEVRKYYN